MKMVKSRTRLLLQKTFTVLFLCYSIFFQFRQGSELHRRLCGKDLVYGKNRVRTLVAIASLSCDMFYPNNEYEEAHYYDDFVQEADIFEKYPEQDHEPDYDTPHIEDTVAYVVTMTTCPEDINDQPLYGDNLHDPGDSIYDCNAISKHSVCNNTVEDTSLYGYTMYALIHPDAVTCEGPNGEPYDRVSMLQQQGYWVEIQGPGVTEAEVKNSQPYIYDNIQEDVGIRDTIRFQAWKFTSHPLVVLMDYDSLVLKPLNEEFDSLLADENANAMIVRNAPSNEGGQGVNTGMLILKPSEDEYENLRQAYMNTPYDDATGWDGKGHNTFPGKMGTPGFFSYYYSHNSSAIELDRCTYSNDMEAGCSAKPFNQIKVAKHSPNTCGYPWACPGQGPIWNAEIEEGCKNIRNSYFKYRYDFETNYWDKLVKQKRMGNHNYRHYLGYCKGEGKDNYLSMVNVERVPEWQILCPIMECPPGSYVTNDCNCSPLGDPCQACPANTRCQLDPVLMCADCECGFCNYEHESCCSFNGVNNCKSNTNDNECLLQHDFFAAIEGEGNTCSGVEISLTATPNGCGCQPNELAPCTYDPNARSIEDKCFICTSVDLANSLDPNVEVCQECRECLSHCDPCIDSSTNSNQFEQCLGSRGFRDNSECRVFCDPYCRKS